MRSPAARQQDREAIRSAADAPRAPVNSAALSAGYRRDVDGLRAVAIVPVLLFHAGVTAFSGGYVGVDVFFVISGFLITGVIAREIAVGRFSIAKFYVRRAKRILPALLTVLVATLAAGYVLLGPSELKDLGWATSVTALSGSNILFWRQTGYFAGPADVKPLLMTWSLGVEEQFYLLWPVTLFLTVRWRIPLRWMVGLVAVVSFGISWWGVGHQPAGAFYLLPPRAWELLAGAALALSALRASETRAGPRLRDAASILGLLLIVISIVGFGRSTRFPGPAALLPCAGTAMLIWAGETAAVNRLLLSRRPLVFTGLISYSLYLWHWPLLAFLRIQHHEVLPRVPAGCAVVLAFVLAYLTWKHVETPFRRPSTRRHGEVLWRYGFATLAVALAGGVTWAGEGFPRRVPPAVAKADLARLDWNPLHWNGCEGTAAELPNPRCIVGPAGKGELVALWGDSHADAIAPAVQAWAASQGRGFAQMNYMGCPPLIGVNVIAGGLESTFCTSFRGRAFEVVTHDPRIGVVVLAARWASLTETTSNEGGPRFFLIDQVSGQLSKENSRRVFVESLRRVTSALRAAGKRVVILGPVPEIGVRVPDCLVRRGMPLGASSSCSIATSEVNERARFATEAIEDLARSTPSVWAFFPAPVLCPGAECLTVAGDRPLYLDDNHLTNAGALTLVEPMKTAAALKGVR